MEKIVEFFCPMCNKKWAECQCHLEEESGSVEMVGDREQGENEFQELLREIALAGLVPTSPAAAPAPVVDEKVMKELDEARYALNRALGKLTDDDKGWSWDDLIVCTVERLRNELWALQKSIDPELRG